MFVFAAFVPPREILDDLWSFAEISSVDAGSATSSAGGGKGKLWRRRKKTVEAEPTPVLELAPVAQVHLPLAKFGNLALNDANRLSEALTASATEWPSPRLRFAGYSTAEAADDPSIWVELDGDLDDLNAVIRGVPEVGKNLRLFVDRRVFRPRVRLGTVASSATEPQLEAVLAKLDRFETNAWWQSRIGLFTLVDHGRDEPSFKTFADIPLGPHVAH